MNLYEAIYSRKSVRKYTRERIPEATLKKIRSFAEKAAALNNRIRVETQIIDCTQKKPNLKGLWKVEAPYYLLFYSEQGKGYERNAGYILEQTVLYMTTKGIGSCYLGGCQMGVPLMDGMRRVMVVAFGYPEGKLYRESPLAKRLPLSELCIFKEEAGEQTKTVLKAARLAPSAMNIQPWRFIVYSDRIYIFAKNTVLPMKRMEEMREVSMGIMMSHIMLAAEELWLELISSTDEQFEGKSYKSGEYVATVTLH